MNIRWLIIAFGSGLAMTVAAGQPMRPTPTNAPARIALRDQFDAPRALAFPTTNLTFLTIADKAGSEQIPAWVEPIKQRFGDRVTIEGIADVSAAPRPLRGLVRRGFQKNLSHPILLDWSGDVVKAFAVVPGRANVFVLDAEGRILHQFAGAATTEAVKTAGDAIEKALADDAKRVASR
jgi:hypothetical protein